MAFKRARARVAERSTTSGSGPWTLGGVLDNSYQAFSSFLSNGDTIEVTVREPGVAVWTGIATFGSSGSPAITTITPTTVEETYGTFGSGTKEISADFLASRALFKEDISGAITSGGTSTAYTASSLTGYASLTKLHNQMVVVVVHATNGAGGVTLAVDGLAAKPWRLSPGVELPQGTLIQGTPYPAYYNNTDGAFYMPFIAGNPLGIPLGGSINGYFNGAPNSCFAAPNGQAISRTVYATFFSLVAAIFGSGTHFGSGNGTTTFNIPDEQGYVEAMIEASASVLSSTYFGADSTIQGTKGGGQSKTLLTANLPAYTPSGSVSSSLSGGNAAVPIQGSTVPGSPVSAALQGNNTSGGTTLNAPVTGAVSSSFSGSAQGGTSTPISAVQGTIVKGRFLRVL
jgi:hypothetical protein